jgi:PAS domain S-box-containing protein
MRRPTHVVTPGWLSKLTGIPKPTIVNWLEGRVARPRSADVLETISDALRLSFAERERLFASVGMHRVLPPTFDLRFDHLPLGLYATTPDGRILHANRTLVEMLGYRSLEEYRSIPVEDLYVEPSHRMLWLAKIEEKGTLYKETVRVKRRDGSMLILLDSATAVRDESGAIVYFEGAWERPGRD